MKNLLEFLLIHLCRFPEEVKIDEEVRDRETVFTLHVHPDDMGRVIGKNGSIIQAIRTIAKVRAVKEGIRATIILAEDQPAAETPAEAGEATEPTEASEVEAE